MNSIKGHTITKRAEF